LQELACCGGVADGGFFVDAEDGGQVQRVGAVGECLFELAVDGQMLQGGGQTAEGVGDPDLADRAGFQCVLLIGDRVGVGGVGPVGALVVQSVEDRLAGVFVQGAGVAGGDQAVVAQVDVIEEQFADG
jgi:hypothetical protein